MCQTFNPGVCEDTWQKMNSTSNDRKTEHLREGHEPPEATAGYGWRYHHIGIPTQTPRPDEIHVTRLGIHISAFETSACGVQWMRFDPDAPYPEVIKTVAHVAFEVDDLAAALVGQEILIPPNSPSEGVMVAMILDHGAPVELLEFASQRNLHAK